MFTRTNSLLILSSASALFLAACGDSGGGAGVECNFDSTYEAIQTTVFDANGCTNAACHGAAADTAEGGLDLREGFSHAALTRIASEIDPAIERVFPGDQDDSLLYRKLQAKLTDEDLGALGQAMPVGGDALTEDQLSAIRLWIRGGAREEGIVEGTLELLGCAGEFDADPNKIDPLPAPLEGTGVQYYAGAWGLDPEAEDEICYATYYNFSDQVPPDFRVPCEEQFGGEGRECFAFRRNELAQDGQSHHSIITVYTPKSDPLNGDWGRDGEWECLGGESNGQICDPTDAGACGARSQCTTPVVTSLGCTLYPFAPADFGDISGAITGTSQTRVSLSGAQESTFVDLPPAGVYSVLPIEGFVAWNSHAFNLTEKDTTIEQWVNMTFAPPEERTWLRRGIFEAGDIFKMSANGNPVPPFTKREICTTFELPQFSRLLSLSSHMHSRGELFRIWLPPNEPACGLDCIAPEREADYISRLYDDPEYVYYDPPLEYNAAEDATNDRTFKACAVYDNGEDNPLEVKRESTKPNTPICNFPAGIANCGCEPEDRYCFGGDNEGTPCDGDDSACGDGGMCDACGLRGGVTTDDEMFIPLGSYYVED